MENVLKVEQPPSQGHEELRPSVVPGIEISPSSSNSSLTHSYRNTSLELEDAGSESSDSHQATSACGPSAKSATYLTLRSPPCITFAPLPELAPRKRRNSQPLGVAARSQYLQNRRRLRQEMYESGEVVQCYRPPMWEEDEHVEEMDDPFVAVGKMFKSAGKSLWRSMRSKKKKKGQEGREAMSDCESDGLEKELDEKVIGGQQSREEEGEEIKDEEATGSQADTQSYSTNSDEDLVVNGHELLRPSPEATTTERENSA